METVAQLGAAAAELIEAELRSLRRTAARMAAAAAIGVLILLLALVAAGFLVAALFLALDRAMSPAGSAATVAAFALLIAGAFLFAAWRLVTTRTRAADVVAAKAQMMNLIEELDIFIAIRRHPFLSTILATAAGAMLAVSTDSLVGAAALTRSLSGLLRTLVQALREFLADPPPPQKPVAKAP
jgi:hypothetical protein